MSNANKKIIIDADASGFESAMNDATNAAKNAKNSLKDVSDSMNDYGSDTSALYERLKKDAQDYSDKLKEQEKYIRDMLNLENRRNELNHKERQTALQEEREKQIENALTQEEEKKVNERYDRFEGEYNSEYMAKKREILEAEQARLEDDFREEEDDGTGKKKRKGRSAFAGTGRAVTSALGVGVGLGIAGILYETIKQADNYQKSLKELNGVMGGLAGTSDKTGVALGKSATEMNKFVESVARSTGGIGNIGQLSSDLLKVAKAFTLDEGQVVGTGRYAKMGTQDVADEIRNLIQKLDESGAVSIKDENFADLSNQIEYWSRLQEMQSSQVLKLSGDKSSDILSAFEKLDFRGTGAKDERIMNTIENVNQAITNPDNDFKRAFMYRWLSNNGQLDFFDTTLRMEQGIFGKDNFKDIMEGFFKDNQAMDKKNKILKFKEHFNFELESEAKAFYESIEDPDKRKEFYADFDNAIKGDGLTLAEFEKKHKGLNIGGRAAANTAFSEKVIANLNNIFAGAGIGILDGLNDVMPKGGFAPGDISGLINSGLQAIGFKDFGELFLTAVNIFKGAANIFSEAVRFLLPSTGEDYKKFLHSQAKQERQNADGYLTGSMGENEKGKIRKASSALSNYMAKTKYEDWDNSTIEDLISKLREATSEALTSEIKKVDEELVNIKKGKLPKLKSETDDVRNKTLEDIKKEKEIIKDKTPFNKRTQESTSAIINDDTVRLLVSVFSQLIDKTQGNTGVLQDLTRTIDGKFNQRGPRGEAVYG